MSEEENVQAVEADANGTPDVADSDYLGAIGLDDETPKADVPSVQTVTPPVEKPEAVKEEVKETNPPKRKIKYQGQEVEIEPEKETEFIQKGFDYTQKMQQLAAEREIITPYTGVIKALQNDPVLQKKIAEHLAGTKEEPKQFDDPIEQLKYETRQEVLKEVEAKFIKPLAEQQHTSNHQMQINSIKAQVQSDPMFQDVQGKIMEHINSMPPTVAQMMYRTLDQDPQSYLEMYKSIREKIPDNKTPEVKTPAPVKKEEHAPILESANSAPTESASKKDEARVKDLNKKYRQTGDLKVLAELIERGGMMKGVLDI